MQILRLFAIKITSPCKRSECLVSDEPMIGKNLCLEVICKWWLSRKLDGDHDRIGRLVGLKFVKKLSWRGKWWFSHKIHQKLEQAISTKALRRVGPSVSTEYNSPDYEQFSYGIGKYRLKITHRIPKIYKSTWCTTHHFQTLPIHITTHLQWLPIIE
jgi:hypothetical protein